MPLIFFQERVNELVQQNQSLKTKNIELAAAARIHVSSTFKDYTNGFKQHWQDKRASEAKYHNAFEPGGSAESDYFVYMSKLAAMITSGFSSDNPDLFKSPQAVCKPLDLTSIDLGRYDLENLGHGKDNPIPLYDLIGHVVRERVSRPYKLSNRNDLSNPFSCKSFFILVLLMPLMPLLLRIGDVSDPFYVPHFGHGPELSMPGAKRLVFLVMSFAKAPAQCAIPLNFLPEATSSPEALFLFDEFFLSLSRTNECSIEYYLRALLHKHKNLACQDIKADDIKKVITDCHLWSFDATPTEWHEQVWAEMQSVNTTKNTVFVF